MPAPGRQALALALILTLTWMACAPVASADPLNVFDVDTYSRRIAGGEEATYSWVVFNNGTSPILVTFSAHNERAGELTISFDPAFVALEPGDSHTCAMTVATDQNMGDANITIHVTFSSTPMDGPSNMTSVQRSAILVVDSNLGNVGVNAIFGIWPNPLPPPLDGNWGAFLVTIIGWVIIALFFAFVLDPLVHRITRRTKTSLDDIILRIIR